MAAEARARSRSPRRTGDDSEIMQYIIAREQARQKQDFAQADEYRNQLSMMNVTIQDKNRTWSCSTTGQTGRIPLWNELNASSDPLAETATFGVVGSMPRFDAGDYVGAQESFVSDPGDAVVPPGDEVLRSEIQSLVFQREQARAAKNFELSDDLRLQLQARGIEVSDREKIWKNTDKSLMGIVVGFDANGVTDTEINTIVLTREKARKDGDWALSDMVRIELGRQGVKICDNSKTWASTSGRSGAIPSWDTVDASRQGGSGNATALHTRTVVAAPAAHAVAPNPQDELVKVAITLAQNPTLASQALVILRAQFGAHLGGLYAPAPVAPIARLPVAATPVMGIQRLPVATVAPSKGVTKDVQDIVDYIRSLKGQYINDGDIAWAIEARERCRKASDYAGGDAIRQAIRETMDIEIKESLKTWTMSDGRSGEIPRWDQLL